MLQSEYLLPWHKIIWLPLYNSCLNWESVIKDMYSNRPFGGQWKIHMIWYNICILQRKTQLAKKVKWLVQCTQLTLAHLTSKSIHSLHNTSRFTVIKNETLTLHTVKGVIISDLLCNFLTYWLETFIHTLWVFHHHFSVKVIDQINAKTCCSSLPLSFHTCEAATLLLAACMSISPLNWLLS